MGAKSFRAWWFGEVPLRPPFGLDVPLWEGHSERLALLGRQDEAEGLSLAFRLSRAAKEASMLEQRP